MIHQGKYHLRCPVCSTTHLPESTSLTCRPCNAPLVIRQNLEPTTPIHLSSEPSMWRYFDLLPLNDRKWIVSQGEGRTPLLESPRLARDVGVGRLWLKNETVNPTGAFKDRQISFGMSKASEAGADTIAVVSSGNVAASAASYSAIAGITCLVFTPSNAPVDRLIQARMYGARFFQVRTVSSSLIFERVVEACAQNGWHLLSTAGLYNPYQVEGAKTIAYELSEQTESLPDWIIVPVGGGGLLGALWRGFSDLKALGRIEKIPALVGVQSSQCTPLVQAIDRGLTPAQVVANPVEVGRTIAGAIADDILFDAYTALAAIRETGGRALGVTDDQMLDAEKQLARRGGIFAEPASASTLAGLRLLVEANVIGENHSVCCVVTGSGFKDMDSARTLIDPPQSLEPTLEAFKKLAV